MSWKFKIHPNWYIVPKSQPRCPECSLNHKMWRISLITWSLLLLSVIIHLFSLFHYSFSLNNSFIEFILFQNILFSFSCSCTKVSLSSPHIKENWKFSQLQIERDMDGKEIFCFRLSFVVYLVFSILLRSIYGALAAYLQNF